jgi:co-chaperonin GroES (HSP10)
MSNLKMLHAVDPRDELMKSVGDLSKVKLFNNQILCAVYKRPEKTASGIYLTDNTRKEDEYQGKVAVVLKKGPMAFQDDAQTAFNGQNVEIGDWVVFRVSDGWQVTVNGVLCRMLQDIQIRMTIDAPDVVF